MPGMIDTHRHMWQTAMRGYGADWTLTQYFVWYYLESGKHFRPEDVHAGNLLAAAEALDAGVTTCVDWSHGLQTVAHADAAVDALRAVPGPVRARLRQHPAGARGSGRRRRSSRRSRAGCSTPPTTASASRWPLTSPATRRSRRRPLRGRAGRLGVPVTTHAGVWGATNDDGIRLAHEAGFLDESSVFVHAATLSADSYHRIAATGGSVSVSDRERAERGPGLPAHVGVARARHPGVAVDGHQRLVERRPVLGHAHDAGRRPVPRALRGPRRRATRSPTAALRAEHVVDWATRGGAKALGREADLGSLEVGKKADLVLIKNDALPGVVPAAQPLRPRRLPGPARRRAHRAGRRAGREVGPPPGRGRPGRRPPRGRERRSSTCARPWARRPGRRA